MKGAIGFIGAGVTGTALAVQLWRNGYPVAAVNSRSTSSADRLASMVSGCTVYSEPQLVADNAGLVFITTPDDIIADMAASVRWRPGQTVIHCSGVHSTDILEPASLNGANICCLHPLQTFASIAEAIDTIPGSTIAVEGNEEGLATARELAEALQGMVIILKAGDKVLYHAAAVTLSNYLVALMKTAADFWQSFGIPQDIAVKSLLPLLKGTVNNIERVGIPGCLTGPIARGDIETVRKHITALECSHPGSVETYRLLGLKTLLIAQAKGRISPETRDEIRDVLEGRQQGGRSYFDDIYKELGFDLAAGHMDMPPGKNTADRIH